MVETPTTETTAAEAYERARFAARGLSERIAMYFATAQPADPPHWGDAGSMNYTVECLTRALDHLLPPADER